jgi:hypothetical protein
MMCAMGPGVHALITDAAAVVLPRADRPDNAANGDITAEVGRSRPFLPLPPGCRGIGDTGSHTP